MNIFKSLSELVFGPPNVTVETKPPNTASYRYDAPPIIDRKERQIFTGSCDVGYFISGVTGLYNPKRNE